MSKRGNFDNEKKLRQADEVTTHTLQAIFQFIAASSKHRRIAWKN